MSLVAPVPVPVPVVGFAFPSVLHPRLVWAFDLALQIQLQLLFRR